MKKRYLLFLLVLFLFPINAFAYGIKDYYINATVLSNGDLEVEEYFQMNGDYNGMERIINYKNSNAYEFNPDAPSYSGNSLHNGNGIDILEVRAVDANSDFIFKNIKGDIFKLVNSANSGDYGVYTETKGYNGNTIRIFLPSKKNKAFYIKYKLHNMAILHNDVAELGWNAIGDSLNESIENLVVYVNIPNNQNEIRVWAHGPLNGTSEIINNNQIKAKIYGLDANTAIDVRIVFDKDVIKDSKKLSNVNALDKILLYEEDLAEQANEQRRQSDEHYLRLIESDFSFLNRENSRENYNETLEHINMLNESEKKTELLNKLETYQDKVDIYEYNEFKTYISGELKYQNYEKALVMIDNVFSTELKNKMMQEADDYYKKLEDKDFNIEAILTGISLLTLAITVCVYKNPFYIKKKVDPYYYRELPSDLAPAAVGLLVDKKINKNEVAASIMDLIRRKVIIVEKSKNNSYDFILNEKETEAIEKDKDIIDLIFSSGKKRINSKKIKKIPYYKYSSFKKTTVDKLRSKPLIVDYFGKEDDEKNGILFEIGLIMLLTPLFPIGIILMIIHSIRIYRGYFYIWMFSFLNLVLIVFSAVFTNIYHFSIIICLIDRFVIKRILKRLPRPLSFNYTEAGLEEYNKWNGLRNFLIDFSKMDDKEIPEITLWEKYLVYATALGVGKKVLNSMKIKMEQYQNMDLDTFLDIMDTCLSTSSISRITDNVIAASAPKVSFPIASAIGSAAASGSYSSGGGHGGGFSGGSHGGGHFGGGGGGGRF